MKIIIANIMFFFTSVSFLMAAGGNKQVRKLDLYWSNYDQALKKKDSESEISKCCHSYDINFGTVLDESRQLVASQNKKERELGFQAFHKLMQVKYLPAYEVKVQMLIESNDISGAVSLLTVMKDLKGGQRAYGYLGDIYSNHLELGGIEEAQSCYIQGIEKGDPYCLHAHGLYCLYNGEPQKGYDLLDQAAQEYNFLPTQLFLGDFYAQRSTVNYDPLLAQHYFSLAYLSHKNGFAAGEVGRILVNGEVTHHDGEEVDQNILIPVGINWLECGSNAGNIYATQMLEDIYSKGIIVPANQKLARDYGTKALKQGQEQGQFFCPPIDMQVSSFGVDALTLSTDRSQNILFEQKDEIEPSKQVKPLEMLTTLAQEKYLPAMVKLALLYRDGNGLDQDKERALVLLKEAAEIYNYAPAYREWGGIVLAGNLVQEAPLEAVKLFKKAADLGDAVAQSNYAYLLCAGPESVRDVALAQVYWQKACEQELPSGLFNYGVYLLTVDDHDQEGFRKIEKAASLKSRDAYYWMGIQYALFESVFVERNPDTAFNYFVKAFDGRDKRVARAILQLVKEGEFTLPTVKDPGFAAIVDGLNLIGPEDPSAFYELGELYRQGKMFKQSSNRAMTYYKSAQTPESFYHLGLHAMQQNKKKEATVYFCRGAQLGSVGCKLHYGTILLAGSGVEYDLLAALKYLTDAKREGSKKAGEYLDRFGELYGKSLVSQPKEYDDDAEAFIKQMCSQGNVKSGQALKVSQVDFRDLKCYEITPYSSHIVRLIVALQSFNNQDITRSSLEQFSAMLCSERKQLEKSIKKEKRRKAKKNKSSASVVLKTNNERQHDNIMVALRNIEQAQLLMVMQPREGEIQPVIDTHKEKQCTTLFAKKNYDGAVAIAHDLASSGSVVGFMTLGRCALFGLGNTSRNVYVGIKLLSHGRNLISQESAPKLHAEITQVLNNIGQQLIEHARAYKIASDPQITQEFCDAVMSKNGDEFIFSQDERKYLLLALYNYFFEPYKELKVQSDEEMKKLRANKPHNFKAISANLVPLYKSLQILQKLLPDSVFKDS